MKGLGQPVLSAAPGEVNRGITITSYNRNKQAKVLGVQMAKTSICVEVGREEGRSRSG